MHCEGKYKKLRSHKTGGLFLILCLSQNNVETYCDCYCSSFLSLGAVVIVIVWLLDLQLPMQSVPIITDVVSSNLDQGDVYNIM